jgi:aspartyl-tRNA(Asn)/glutamyl-tRNA(Gln) amidotransferase subunit B
MKISLTPVIGMEIHVELNTHSKMFCGCPADHFGKPPNTQTCPVCLGLPGALPVPNQKAIEWTYLIGHALNCQLSTHSKFDRKHYFYPDLPKGFQLSQYDQPFCTHGFVELSEGKVRITRVHLEEDTGKLQHTNLDGKPVSLVDFNRSGVPLVEIVTEPDIVSGSEAVEYTKKIQQILRFLKVSDADMEKGSMRLEANISLKPAGSPTLPAYKVEVKNLNSHRFLKKAIDFEINRQSKLLLSGVIPDQETRGWHESSATTQSQRSKEESLDYRYFPEPDIPEFIFDEKVIASMLENSPPLPGKFRQKLRDLNLREDYIDTLLTSPEQATWAVTVLQVGKSKKLDTEKLANFIINQQIDHKVQASDVIDQFSASIKKPQATDEEMLLWVKKVIKSNPELVSKYHQGKKQVIGALVGKVLILSNYKASPQRSMQLLIMELDG